VREPPEINYRAELHPYEQIAAWLRADIESGELGTGDVLPSQKDITDLTGVAATTVRRAIRMLRDEGLVRTVPARGTYVAQR
jgi:GntR family transcriptional regulator